MGAGGLAARLCGQGVYRRWACGRWLVLGVLGGMLAACGGAPYGGYRHATPHPVYKIGAPYEVKGVWYYPHVDYGYDQVGYASWYGAQFEGRLTANGEVFEVNGLTAAHKTLPLPSIVEVVNLQNGRALRLRVNDRGPFVDGRIIDLSRHAAQLLGFDRAGLARVRVRILPQESIRAAEELMHGRYPVGTGNDGVLIAAAPPAGAMPLTPTR